MAFSYTAFPSSHDPPESGRPKRVPGVGLDPDEMSVDAYDYDALVSLGSFDHDVGVPLERMIENVLDYEHFPNIHPADFKSSDLLQSGPKWLRMRFGNSDGSHSQVLSIVHPSNTRWTFDFEHGGPHEGLLIHQEATIVDDQRISVRISFFLREPPRSEAVRKALFQVFRARLQMLYNQDAVIMRQRQDALDRRTARTTDVVDGSLGSVEDVRERAPFRFTLDGRRFWVRQRNGELEAFAAECPHMFGPLACPREGEDDEVVCPWHRYRFDAGTGSSTDGRGIRLPRPPQLVVSDGQVRVGRA